jgi:glycosyltransferase involved in cell wall biosynthesis
MRVMIDGIVFEASNQRGIHRYYTELLTRLPKSIECDLWLDGEAVLPIPPGMPVIKGYRRWWKPSLTYRVKRELSRRGQRAMWAGYDVFHSTFFSPPPVPDMPQVVTVHDMAPEHFPDLCGVWGRQQAESKAAAIKTAARIIAISHATGDELAAYYPEVRDRIRVIHHGADHLLARSQPTQAPSKPNAAPYAMYVGDRAGYKNFRVILDAMTHINWPRDVRLAIAGSPFDVLEQLNVKRLGLMDRIEHRGRVSDDELTALYAGAHCVIVPSLDEGFGFPTLEAQAMRAPLVCSDIPVFREVAGEAACYFDQRRGESLAAAVVSIMDDAERDRLRQLGEKNLQRFSWKRCAESTAAVFKEVAQG